MESAFLAAIAEAPEDDAPRLVYADWLDDNGHAEQASFVREECGKPESPAITAPAAWTAVLRELRGDERVARAWLCRRGVPVGVRFGPRDVANGDEERIAGVVGEFLEAAKLVFLELPTAREVILDAMEIIAYDYGKEYRPLEDRGVFDEQSLRSLAGLADLARLERLALTNGMLSRSGLEILLGSAHLTKLRHLSLSGCELYPDDAGALAGSPLAPRLESLDLSGGTFGYQAVPRVSIDVDGVLALARTATFATLTALDLSGNNLNNEAAGALLASPHFPRLTRVCVAGHSLSDDRLSRLRERFADLSGAEQRWRG